LYKSKRFVIRPSSRVVTFRRVIQLRNHSSSLKNPSKDTTILLAFRLPFVFPLLTLLSYFHLPMPPPPPPPCASMSLPSLHAPSFLHLSSHAFFSSLHSPSLFIPSLCLPLLAFLPSLTFTSRTCTGLLSIFSAFPSSFFLPLPHSFSHQVNKRLAMISVACCCVGYHRVRVNGIPNFPHHYGFQGNSHRNGMVLWPKPWKEMVVPWAPVLAGRPAWTPRVERGAVLTGVPPDPPFLLPFCLPTARVGGCDIFFEVTFIPFFIWRGVPRIFLHPPPLSPFYIFVSAPSKSSKLSKLKNVKLYWPSGAVRGLRSFIIAGSYYIIMSIYVTYDISRPDGRGAYVAGAVRY
jgi:hypothetical protein